MHFNAVTWNVLAQAYIRPERYEGVPPQHLEAEGRRRLLLQRVRDLDADLLCLQEVEPELFVALQGLLVNHSGVYEQKRGKPDGLATFARRDRFTLEGSHALHYQAVEPGYDHLALFVQLRQGGQRLVVANTHLRWQGREVPAAQHQGLLQLKELLADPARDPEASLLIAGDFNAGHDSPVLAEAKRAGLTLSTASLRPWDTALINGRRRKLDYLLIQRGRLSPSPRPLPQLSRSAPIPSAREPSDHLPLHVDYRWC